MSALTFFNPAAFLPGPNVAVKPPPVNDTFSFALSQGLEEVNKVSKNYFEIQSLTKETESLAQYAEKQSPELAKYLRDKAANYNIGTTDANEERKGLFTGFLGMAKLESDDRQAAMRSANPGEYQLYGAKLTAAHGIVENLTRLKNEFDQNELAREKEHNNIRDSSAKKGIITEPYQRQTNPYDSQLTDARGNLENMLSRTPDSVPKSGSIGPVSARPSNPALPSGSSASQGDINEAQGMLPPVEDGRPVPMSGGEGSLFNYGPGPNTPESQLTENNPEPPNLMPQPRGNTSAPQPGDDASTYLTVPEFADTSGRNAVLANKDQIEVMPPVSDVAGKDKIEVAPPSAMVDPNSESDPYKRQALIVQQQHKAQEKIINSSAKAMIDAINANKEFFINPSDAKMLGDSVNDAIKQINELPDPGSATWAKQAEDILAIAKYKIESAPKKTKAENKDEREEATENANDYVVRDPKTGKTGTVAVKIFTRDTSAGKKYFLKMPDGSKKDVTDEINKTYIPRGGKVNVTAPGVTLPKTFDDIMKVQIK